MTISYTALVAGDQRSEATRVAFCTCQASLRHASGPRYLAPSARLILYNYCDLVHALCGVGSNQGRPGQEFCLQNLDLLRNQQAIIAAERLKLETSLDKPADEAALRDQLNRGIIRVVPHPTLQ